MTALTITLVFGTSFTTAILWAFYIKHLGKENMFKAAIFGELIVICGAVSTINYVHNGWYLIPIIVGGFLGTILSNKVKLK